MWTSLFVPHPVEQALACILGKQSDGMGCEDMYIKLKEECSGWRGADAGLEFGK